MRIKCPLLENKCVIAIGSLNIFNAISFYWLELHLSVALIPAFVVNFFSVTFNLQQIKNIKGEECVCVLIY